MASHPIISWQIDGETVETVAEFIFLCSKITADGDCSHEIKRRLLLRRKVMTNLNSIFGEGKSTPMLLLGKSYGWRCLVGYRPKYRSFSFSISSSNEYSGLISCRIDWLDLLAVQGSLKSLHQHHSSKASIP